MLIKCNFFPLRFEFYVFKLYAWLQMHWKLALNFLEQPSSSAESEDSKFFSVVMYEYCAAFRWQKAASDLLHNSY